MQFQGWALQTSLTVIIIQQMKWERENSLDSVLVRVTSVSQLTWSGQSHTDSS